ncbi:MAG: Nif3-like dinuclear metal center hexameric protein [Lachnotalea sp.]
MKCSNLIEAFEQLAPLHMAQAWDNIGMLVGTAQREINSIYIALDSTDEVIKDATNKKVDLLLTHHPLIFKSLKSVTEEEFIGRRITNLIKANITYYAMHTNFDVAVMADLAADYLCLSNREILEKTDDSHGIGKIGMLPKAMTLDELCQYVKSVFAIESLKVFGNRADQVEKVVIMPGSGKSYIKNTIQSQAQVMITGDIDHHEGLDALACGLNIIDAGHYGIEHIFVKYMQEYINNSFSEIKVFTEKVNAPFEIV